jgi:hypothetical protein
VLAGCCSGQSDSSWHNFLMVCGLVTISEPRKLHKPVELCRGPVREGWRGDGSGVCVLCVIFAICRHL